MTHVWKRSIGVLLIVMGACLGVTAQTETGTISGKVWRDENSNAVYDAGIDTLLEGVAVEIWAIVDHVNTKFDETLTDGNGAYQFVDPPQYPQIHVAKPENHLAVAYQAGDDPVVDSDYEPYIGYLRYDYWLDPGEIVTNWDAGFYLPPASPGSDYTLDWAVALEGDFTNVLPPVIDFSGNIIVSGTFQSPIDFDPGVDSYILTPRGEADAFVAKYSAEGQLVWARQYGAEKEQDHYDMYSEGIYPIAIGPDGHVYAALTYNGPGDLDPGPGEMILPFAGLSCALLKLDADGSILWARPFVGVGNDGFANIEFDSVGNIYFGGEYAATFDADPGPNEFILDHDTSRLGDIFIIKLSPAGHFLDAISINSNGDNEFGDMIFDDQDRLILAGGFGGITDFDPGPGTDIHVGPGGAGEWGVHYPFVAQYATDLSLNWVKVFSGEGVGSMTSVSIAPDNGLLLSGYYQGELDLDPGPAADPHSTLSNLFNTFVMKLNNTYVREWIWTPTLRDENSYAIGFGGDSDVYGNVVIPIVARGGVDLEPGKTSGETFTHNGGVILVSLDSLGNVSWNGAIYSEIWADAYGLSIASNGDIVVTGNLEGPSDADPGPGYHFLPEGGFLIRLKNTRSSFTITENQLYTALEEQIHVNGGTIAFALPDFSPAGVTLTVETVTGATVTVTVQMDFDPATGLLTITVTPNTTDAALAAVIRAELPGLLTAALDRLIDDPTAIRGFALSESAIHLVVAAE